MLQAADQSVFEDLLDSSGTIKMGRLHHHILSSGVGGSTSSSTSSSGGGGSAVRIIVRPEHVSSDACQFIAFATI